MLNLVEILDATKRAYNVDENRVVVSGVSDGGTGAYWVAMRETTPFASFLPLNGYWMVLASGDIDDGDALRQQPAQQADLRRERRTRSAVSDRDRRSAHRASEARRRHARLSPAAGGRAQHRVVAGGEGHVRDVRARASAHAAAGHADVGNAAAPTPATARTGWSSTSSARSPATRQSLPDLNEMAMPPAPDFGVRAVGMRDQSGHAPGRTRSGSASKAGDARGPPERSSRFRPGMDVAEALEDVAPGSPITLLVARNNLPVELSGTYEPQMAPVPPRQLFARGAPAGPRRSDARGQHRDRRRRAASRRSRCCCRRISSISRKPVKVVANGRTVVRREGRERAADAAEVRGRRQRPHDAVRRRAAHRLDALATFDGVEPQRPQRSQSECLPGLLLCVSAISAVNAIVSPLDHRAMTVTPHGR